MTSEYSRVSAVAVDDEVVGGRRRCYKSSPRRQTILANYSMRRRVLLRDGTRYRGYRDMQATKFRSAPLIILSQDALRATQMLPSSSPGGARL